MSYENQVSRQVRTDPAGPAVVVAPMLLQLQQLHAREIASQLIRSGSSMGSVRQYCYQEGPQSQQHL